MLGNEIPVTVHLEIARTRLCASAVRTPLPSPESAVSLKRHLVIQRITLSPSHPASHMHMILTPNHYTAASDLTAVRTVHDISGGSLRTSVLLSRN